MRAERMREILNKAMADNRAVELNANHAYTKKITETKFKKRARKGFNNCEFRVHRGYSPTLVAENLTDLGYEIKRSSKNGKQYILVKW